MTFWLNDKSDGFFWRHSLTSGIQKAFRHLPQTVWAGLNCVPSIPYPFREWCLGKTGPSRKYHYPRKYRMWYFVSTALIKYPSHMHLGWGSMDPICGSGGKIHWKALEGVGPGNRDFFGPWNGYEQSECLKTIKYKLHIKKQVHWQFYV